MAPVIARNPIVGPPRASWDYPLVGDLPDVTKGGRLLTGERKGHISDALWINDFRIGHSQIAPLRRVPNVDTRHAGAVIDRVLIRATGDPSA